jgi:hypothetical protein
MARTRQTCWNCGLEYDRVFDRCPTDVLGCGADKEEAMDAIVAAEEAAHQAFAQLMKAGALARRSGLTGARNFAQMASKNITDAIRMIDMIGTALRNDKARQAAAKRDAMDPKVVTP